MTLAAVVAATLLAQAQAPAADLAIRPGGDLSGPMRARMLERGPFTGGELAAAGAGALLGDAAVIGLAYGTFHLFTSGGISPTATHYRNAAFGLGAATLLLPPLGAVLGGSFARMGPARGAPWKAFLLSLLGNALALGVGYRLAPNYWAILPVQLATMTTGTSFGLHWGPSPRAPLDAVAPPARRDAPPPAVAGWSPPLCLDAS
ncbi:hypothetical protein [Anaeromyxobacter oryzae]|uniref:Uncharacterized protein n=1 Tax=Anaeromyxobacter oryzae TaxID=2918170 RepID=A0ABN6MU47_9BACT|nr:hypothetical protein [Anaeromyxobacter oryzae]BDG04509.1 hypothetical protein AMOR_35050 [Anaeromyxobacter oryzae]